VLAKVTLVKILTSVTLANMNNALPEDGFNKCNLSKHE